MAFKVETFPPDRFPEAVAHRIIETLPGGGSLILTGGTTIEPVYPRLAAKRDWSNVVIGFSDERCVPPDDPASNYGMARRLFIDAAEPASVHRMKGELGPGAGASDYTEQMAPLVAQGFDLLLLGMGADCHVGALFPGSPALAAIEPAAGVDRPDGLQGITLTPPAMTSARRILLIVSGASKAEAVARAISGDEKPEDCPARLLIDHPDATFLLDETAAGSI